MSLDQAQLAADFWLAGLLLSVANFSKANFISII